MIKLLLSTCLFQYLASSVKASENRDLRSYRVECGNLPDQWNEQIDPYLKIFDKAGYIVYQSPVQDATLRPIFRPSFNWIEDEVYRFVIWDDDGIGSDDPLGQVSIPARNLVGQHSLSNPSGGWILISDTTPTTTTPSTTTTPTTTPSTTTTPTTTPSTTTTPTTTPSTTMTPTTTPSTTTTPTTTLSTTTMRTTTTASATTTTVPPFPVCPPEGVHLYSFPGDCSLYIHCVEGSATVYRCPAELLFEPFQKECVNAEFVHC